MKITKLVLLSVILFSMVSLNTSESKGFNKEKPKEWTFCCNDSSHVSAGGSACVNTMVKYSLMSSCKEKVKSHKKSYPGHGCGCF